MSNELAPTKHFSSVKKARQALQGHALELYQDFRTMIKQAAAAGKWEEALKAQQWLLDHVPGEDGERIFEASSDKPAQVEAKQGPQINIGFALGGLETKSMPKVIEGEKVETE